MNNPEPTLFRWQTSWGEWTYRTERPAGWKDLPRFEAYSLAAPAPIVSPAALTEMTTERIEELWEKETGFGMESSACIAEADILGFARALLAASPADQGADARAVDGLKPGCCHKCGLPLSQNPHPEAGKPDHYLEVGCPRECIPCTVKGRHNWASQAMKNQRDAERYRYLRNEAWGLDKHGRADVHVCQFGPGVLMSAVTELAEEALDAAIDAAMSATPPAAEE